MISSKHWDWSRESFTLKTCTKVLEKKKGKVSLYLELSHGEIKAKEGIKTCKQQIHQNSFSQKPFSLQKLMFLCNAWSPKGNQGLSNNLSSQEITPHLQSKITRKWREEKRWDGKLSFALALGTNIKQAMDWILLLLLLLLGSISSFNGGRKGFVSLSKVWAEWYVR